MFRFCNSRALRIAGCLLVLLPVSAYALEGIGRAATPAEIKAWDIDVRPDFKGLPKGSGTADRGVVLFEEKCASCHGVFGESNEVFTPLVGGTTTDDIKTGHVKSLRTGDAPQRTTLMKVATVSTLFDYIQRAMPWTSPKSLAPNDVYAILAYLLNLAEIVPADFELSDKNIAEVQQRMPNRNGMTTNHGMWPGAAASKGGIGNGGKPDVKAVACMRNCKPSVMLVSTLPEYAEDAHGNLADQNRLVGQALGKQVGKPAPMAVQTPAQQAGKLVSQTGCLACHALKNKVVGPGFAEVAAKYKDKPGSVDALSAKIKAGGAGNWGTVPMPPHPQLSDDQLTLIVNWILSGTPAK